MVLDVKLKLNWSTEFRPFTNIKIYKNLSSANQIAACGQTDGQTWWTNKQISNLFFECGSRHLEVQSSVTNATVDSFHYNNHYGECCYREIITFYYESHTTHINTQCGQNIQFLNVETAGNPCLKLLMIQIAQFSFSTRKTNKSSSSKIVS